MADYGTSDTSTTNLGANQFPISDVYVPNTGLRATEGGPVSTDAGGKASAPTSMYVKDGGNVVEGSTTDAAVTGDNSGSHSAKLRGFNKIWADVWDSVNHLFHFNQKQIGGTAIDTNSGNKSAGTQRVVLATDQPAVPVSGTFWQATQPVSGTFWQATQPVSGTFWQATQPVSLSSLPALAAGSALIGSVELVDSAGTNKAAIDSAGNQAMKGGFAEQTGLTAGSLNADLVPATDVSGYKSLSLQIDGTAYSGTLTFQWSNDNSNFYPLVMTRIDSNGSNTATTTTLNATGFCTNVFFHYFRVRMTSWTSGAAHGTLDLFTFPMTFVPVVDQGGVWTVQPGNTANTTAWKVDGSAVTQPVSGTFWQATQPVSGTVTANQGGAPWSDNLTQIGGTNVVTGGAAGLLAIGGPVASAGANADNPVKMGGVFNTTQPTVTTGQIIDLQATARGAAIVAPGVDGFAVTANAGTNLNTSALALDTSVNGVLLAQASTTSGQKGPLLQGAVTTGFPAYTTAQTSPLSLNLLGQLRVDTTSGKTTYGASYTALVGVSGVLFVLAGSASKTVKLLRLEISGIATTAATFDATLTKYSTAHTGGTAVTAATIAPYDSNNAAASATTAAFSAAPTAGTSVGIIRAAKLLLPLTAVLSEKITWTFGDVPEQLPTLRGTAQELGLTLGAAPSGGSININCEWSEE